MPSFLHIDPSISLAGLIVGLAVGLTGMGGGALMTPILVIIFRVQPLAAVSSDLVASFIMKPVGAGVHMRRKTVHFDIVKWLVIGSVPSAFLGVVLLRLVGRGSNVQSIVSIALGIALLLAAGAIVAKAVISARRPGTGLGMFFGEAETSAARPLPTLLVGIVGGLIVGITSVGSGSLIIVMLLFLYPSLRASELVGTDLVQAIPLVGSAALGHILFGDFQMALTASLLVGCVPRVYVGARISSQAAGRFVRPAIAFVLFASGLKLVNATNVELGVILAATLVLILPGQRLIAATGGLRGWPGRRPATGAAAATAPAEATATLGATIASEA